MQFAETSTVVDEFRQLVGPLNPEIARAVRPYSLRAQFGDTTDSSLSRNAVHCTDLWEDGEMECKFMLDTIGSL
jgi:nucleoside-diphosphate kinase